MDLKINPITENAKDLRREAVVCNITFEAYDKDNETTYIEHLISETNSNCKGLNICGVGVGGVEDCVQVTDDDCDPAEDDDCVVDGYRVSQLSSRLRLITYSLSCLTLSNTTLTQFSPHLFSCKSIIPLKNCDCDLVIGLIEEVTDEGDTLVTFAIYTVSYKGDNSNSTLANETLPNDVVMIGLFDSLTSDDQAFDAKIFEDVIPINIPTTPNIVPRFNTLQELADTIGEAITDFTGISTTITVRYTGGTETEPGSFLFGIEFDKDFEVDLSFNSSVSLGDIAEFSVVESLLSISGGVHLSNEFGVSHRRRQPRIMGFIEGLHSQLTLHCPFFVFR